MLTCLVGFRWVGFSDFKAPYLKALVLTRITMKLSEPEGVISLSIGLLAIGSTVILIQECWTPDG